MLERGDGLGFRRNRTHSVIEHAPHQTAAAILEPKQMKMVPDDEKSAPRGHQATTEMRAAGKFQRLLSRYIARDRQFTLVNPGKEEHRRAFASLKARRKQPRALQPGNNNACLRGLRSPPVSRAEPAFLKPCEPASAGYRGRVHSDRQAVHTLNAGQHDPPPETTEQRQARIAFAVEQGYALLAPMRGNLREFAPQGTQNGFYFRQSRTLDLHSCGLGFKAGDRIDSFQFVCTGQQGLSGYLGQILDSRNAVSGIQHLRITADGCRPWTARELRLEIFMRYYISLACGVDRTQGIYQRRRIVGIHNWSRARARSEEH